jgi:hypothetical protein
MYDATLYLDFDGVFNAKKPLHESVEQFIIKVENSINFRPENLIVFSPTVVKTIEAFRHEYNAELVWLTTWNENNTVLRLAEYLGGLDNGRVLPANLHTAQVGKRDWTQWKAEAILTDQDFNARPFVWVDDNAHQYWGEYVKKSIHENSLFIEPVSHNGLTISELDKIDGFLSKVSQKAA